MLLPIQMLWIGASLSRLEHLCMQSFLANGHPVHLYCYQQPDNTPSGVTVMDAAQIMPKDQIFQHKQSYAPFADLFRWQLLATRGGYYADTDVLCVRALDYREDAVLGFEAGKMLNVAVMKMPANHPLALEMRDCALHPRRFKPYDTRRVRRKKALNFFNHQLKSLYWGETAGPPAVTRALAYLRAQGQAQDVATVDFRHFYPVCADNFGALFDGTLAEEPLYQATRAVHLWNEMLRRNGVDKNQPYAPQSLIGRYFAKYCPNYPM